MLKKKKNKKLLNNKMSCNLKRSSNNLLQRSAYDMKMIESYTPNFSIENYSYKYRNSSNNAQFSTRTRADYRLQQKWCPNCTSTSVEGFEMPYRNMSTVGDAEVGPSSTPIERTHSDRKLQQKWCPTC
jgi:hypothetical protein